MGNIWLKIKVWTKLVLFALVAVYVLFFVAMNSGYTATFWAFYHREYTKSVLVLVLLAFGCGVVTTLLVRTSFSTLRQVRELKQRNRTMRMEKQLSEMEAKAAKLQTKPVEE